VQHSVCASSAYACTDEAGSPRRRQIDIAEIDEHIAAHAISMLSQDEEALVALIERSWS
jgi:hypothetical protein